MSLVIRLRKPGKTAKGRHHYKLVVDEKRSKKEGRFIEELGFYDPSRDPELLKIDLDRYQVWFKNGARPTDTVRSLVRRFRKRNKG